MNRARTFTSLLIILLTVASCGLIAQTDTTAPAPAEIDTPIAKWGWKQIEEGISYTITHTEKKDVLIVKIDPDLYKFSIYENRNPVNAKTIEQIHKSTGALLSFNGGFFTEDFIPTGLLISEGKELRSLSKADLLNGVLAIKHDGTINFFYYVNNGKFPISITPENYVFAIQNGPALINEKGENLLTTDTEKLSSRTAIGLDKDNNIILIILKQSLFNPDNAISLYQFSEMIRTAGIFKELGVHSVLNLDGGSSTGLMLDEKYFPEMEKVQNVITVKSA